MKMVLPKEVEACRVAGDPGDNNGHFHIKCQSGSLSVRISNGGGWDHVSVSLKHRCPTWSEMCFVKSLFFKDYEWVMQLHPPKSENVNYHKFCLHLWRPQTTEEISSVRLQWIDTGDHWPYSHESPGTIPLPPAHFVGPTNGVSP